MRNLGFASLIAFALAGSVPGALAQTSVYNSQPTSAGFQLPSAEGSLRFGVSASELVSFGYEGRGTVASTDFSGDLAFLSASATHPFSLVYAGGYLTNTGYSTSSSFHNLALSQVVHAGKWTFIGADSVSYLPETPTSGLSGIPGLGDGSIPPVVIGGGVGAQALILNATRLSNTISGTVDRALTSRLTAEATGAYSISRFLNTPNGSALDSNSIYGSGRLSYRIDARSSTGLSYNYSRFTYPQAAYQIVSQGVNLEYSRQLSRRTSIDLGVGPERTSSNNSVLVPSTTGIDANARIVYATKRSSGSLGYSRATNSGSGLVAGSRSDSLSAQVGHSFSRVLSGSLNAAYVHSSSLNQIPGSQFSTQSVIGGGQLTRQFTRTISGYASYTALQQSISGNALSNLAFNGLSQTIGVGVTYSPQAYRFGHK